MQHLDNNEASGPCSNSSLSNKLVQLEKNTQNFFKNATIKTFKKKKLNTKEHHLQQVYTINLLSSYTPALYKNPVEDLLDLDQKIDSQNIIDSVLFQSFSDHVLWVQGLFPGSLDKLRKSSFYCDRARKFYGLISSSKDDVFSKMEENLPLYISALNYMKENIINKSFSNHDDHLLLDNLRTAFMNNDSGSPSNPLLIN